MNATQIQAQLETDAESRKLFAIHFVEAEAAKDLLRAAGFGVTGTSLLETVKQALQEIQDARH
jgi:hypothetical protein